MKAAAARYACNNISLSGFPGAFDACWEQAEGAELSDVENGKRPFLGTEFRLLRDDAKGAFYLRFLAEDDEIRSTYRRNDETLYKQDVFELFLCDEDSLKAYKEIEISPYDVSFTGQVTWQEERFSINMDWELPGLKTLTRFNKASHQTASVWEVPYAAFASAPAPGKSWRFNVFRIDHSVRGEELQAWQHTGVRNFHVPARFGWLDFTP